MNAIARILLMMAFITGVDAQDSAGHTSTNAGEILPLVEFYNAPISKVIENLARQSKVNCLIDSQLEQTWKNSVEPEVSCKIKNVAAKYVLRRILELRHLTLLEDTEANIAFIVRDSQTTAPVFSRLLNTGTNSPHFHTNDILPLIQFGDVPITTAVENLARQAGINFMFNPNLTAPWNANLTNPWNDSSFKYVPEPLLTVRLEKVTAKNALIGILTINHLVLIDDSVSNISRITFDYEPSPIVDAKLLKMDVNPTTPFTNGVFPLIQFQDVPLNVAFENLIRASESNIMLDPMVKDKPLLSLRWEDVTAKQALVALCQNYDLVITKDSETGIVQIKPK